MMDWTNVLVLIRVAKESLDFPQLKAIHDAALATLAAIDPNDLALGQVDHAEPLEDE